MNLLNRDWTYSEGCGCQVTFFVASEYHTSRMLPGEKCEEHTAGHQTEERDRFLETARKELHLYIHRNN